MLYLLCGYKEDCNGDDEASYQDHNGLYFEAYLHDRSSFAIHLDRLEIVVQAYNERHKR